jgi:hypothetical protein
VALAFGRTFAESTSNRRSRTIGLISPAVNAEDSQTGITWQNGPIVEGAAATQQGIESAFESEDTKMMTKLEAIVQPSRF